MTQGKELAIADIAQYPALRNSTRTIDLVKQALGGSKLSIFSDLTRIRVPGSGGTMWEVPDINEGSRPEKTITGIIIHNQYSRAYYEEPFGGGESGPPDCSSWVFDGVGNGTPGGLCSECAFNQFGTALHGNGKACAEKRFMLMLTQEAFLPLVLQVPVTSMAPMRKFGLDLASGLDKTLQEVVIDLTLKKQDKSGFPTAIIVPKVNSYLSEDDIVKVSKLLEDLAPMMPSPSSPVDVRDDEEFLDDEESRE